MRLSAFGSQPGLERIQQLLEEIGNPHRGLPCVHIAGTNGKGTTSLIIADVLAAAGYRTGRFISPHIHSYCERFTINGREISAKVLGEYLKRIEIKVQAMLDKGFAHPTEFEVLTALAFQYFRDENVDVMVLEVGMGGLYDSTNVVSPIVSVITSIDFDHTEFLGTAIEEIAANKAGIIKKGRPVVTGKIDDKALEVIKAKACQEGAPLFIADMDKVKLLSSSLDGQLVDISLDGHELLGVSYSLLGQFQLQNLATAITAVQVLRSEGYNVRDENIIDALGSLKMPGRLEVLSRNPLVIADVAHNAHAARAIAASLGAMFGERKKVVVCGILDDKDAEETIREIGRNTRLFVITRPEGPRAANWQRIKEICQKECPQSEVILMEDIALAVETGKDSLKAGEYLLLTGSFYVLNRGRRVFVND